MKTKRKRMDLSHVMSWDLVDRDDLSERSYWMMFRELRRGSNNIKWEELRVPKRRCK